MMASEENLAAVGDVLQAAERLADRGLAKREPRGINDDGMQTLADLLSVLIFQTGGGPSHAEQVTSATSRAMLSALADLYSELAGVPTSGADTMRLLATAGRTARDG